MRLRRRWVPLTNLGLLVAVSAHFAYWAFAAPRGDYVIQMASLLAALCVALGLGAAGVGTLVLRRLLDRVHHDGAERPKPIRLEADVGFDEGLEVPRRLFFALVYVRWFWEAPAGVRVVNQETSGGLRERLFADQRGLASEVARRFVVEDGLGLARFSLRRVERRSVELEPCKGSLTGASFLPSVAGGADAPHPFGEPLGDRVEMRRYVAGDPLRLVLWKLYGRTGELMVRTPETAMDPRVRVMAYLPAAKGDEPAAAAASVAIERGLLGGSWMLGTDGAGRGATTPAEALQLIMASRRFRGSSQGEGAGLEPFRTMAEAGASARWVLFVPGVRGPWLETCVRTVRDLAARTSVVIAVDPAATPSQSRFERWFKLPAAPKEGGASLDEIRAVSDVFLSIGAQVTVVDRRYGTVVHASSGAVGIPGDPQFAEERVS